MHKHITGDRTILVGGRYGEVVFDIMKLAIIPPKNGA